MADHIKYAVSVDVVDEYVATTAYTDDESDNAGSNVAKTSYRHYSAVGKTLGGSVSATTTATGGIEIAGNISGYSSGDPTYAEATVSGGTATTLGSAGYDMVFVKNTGFDYDSGLGSTARTTETVKVTIGAQIIAELHNGGAIILPKVPAEDVKVQSSDASNNITVEYCLVT
jgi:hypothetical protein